MGLPAREGPPGYVKTTGVPERDRKTGDDTDSEFPWKYVGNHAVGGVPDCHSDIARGGDCTGGNMRLNIESTCATRSRGPFTILTRATIPRTPTRNLAMAVNRKIVQPHKLDL